MKKLSKSIKAIIWDYDNTLVDTHVKNYNVTKRIIKDMTGTEPDKFPLLASLQSYILTNNSTTNWRDMYKKELNFTEKEIDYSGKLWSPYQLKEKTAVPFFDGIQEVVKSLKMFPQGIVSQNSKDGIDQQLKKYQLQKYFGCLIGYEEVPLNKQKPESEGLLMCIKKLTDRDSGLVIYIGDHETDTQCAHNANQQLTKNASEIEIISIGAFYGSNSNTTSWNIKPDYAAYNPGDILEIIRNLNA